MAEPENTPQPPRDERWERRIAASPPAAVPDELVLVLVRAYLAAIGCAEAEDAEIDPETRTWHSGSTAPDSGSRSASSSTGARGATPL